MEFEHYISNRLNNLLHAFLLLGGMCALLMAIGWVLGGVQGLIWTPVVGLAGMLLAPRVSPHVVLAMYRAQALAPSDSPGLYRLLEGLAMRAGLPARPRLYYIPSAMMNAFSLGMKDRSAIAVSDGLLRVLNGRELAGVLAHEVSHIHHNDMWTMSLADTVSRMVRLFSFVGQVLVLINLPMMLMNARPVPWLVVLLLVFAPSLSALLQMALSRNREFDADLEAVRLTGDAHGLMSALSKLDASQDRLWKHVLWPYRGTRQPSLLRTHPATQARIERLREAAGDSGKPYPSDAGAIPLIPARLSAPVQRPRHRWHGVWN